MRIRTLSYIRRIAAHRLCRRGVAAARMRDRLGLTYAWPRYVSEAIGCFFERV
jgi:hypothetical protein